MNERRVTLFAGGMLLALMLAATFNPSPSPCGAQSAACDESKCAGSCLAHQYFLSKNLDSYIRWYDTAFVLTDCDEPAWKRTAYFMLDVIGDMAGAPGAPTLNCEQMFGGQMQVCEWDCEDNACLYAPNVVAIISSCADGMISGTVDNHHYTDGLPEQEPTTYSRRFTTSLFVSHGDGPQLLLNRQEIPSLSYPNWIESGGYDTCVSEYGADDMRCMMLESFVVPDEQPIDYAWGGLFYDMTDWISSSDGMGGSPADGYITLMSDGDEAAISQGGISGYAYVWDHNVEDDTISETVTSWDASGGDVAFENEECNCGFCWCNLWHVRHDVDTTIYATYGPTDDAIAGDYTITASAPMNFDKDLSNNTATCSYTIDAPPSDGSTDDGAAGGDSGDSITDAGLAIVDVSAGVTIGSDADIIYRLAVPPGLKAVSVRLEQTVITEGNVDLYIIGDALPDPIQIYLTEWLCSENMDGGYPDSCWLEPLNSSVYYILVHRDWGTGDHRLTIEFIQPPPGGSGSREGDNTTESDGPFTGDLFNQGGTITGRLDVAHDRDCFSWTASEAAIAILTLTDVPPTIEVDMTIYNGDGDIVQAEYDAHNGESITLPVDTNEGEDFSVCLISGNPSRTSDQAYTLTFSTLPDPCEPDDTDETACAWDGTEPMSGYFMEKATGRYDIYTVTPTSDGTVTLTLTDVPAEVNANLVVFDMEGEPIASMYNAAKGEDITLTFDVEGGSTYLIRVYSKWTTQISIQPYYLIYELDAVENGR